MGEAENSLDRIFRKESRAVLATLIRILGDFDLAEDTLQDAFASRGSMAQGRRAGITRGVAHDHLSAQGD